MADKKISDLVELTSLAADDVLPVVDADANATKRVTYDTLASEVRSESEPLTATTITASSFAVSDGGTIGSASDADAITIDATGNVALSQALQLGDSTAISSLGADAFRLTADTASNGVLTAWERLDDQTFSGFGSGMTVSSGVFTFPSTGYWLVTAIFAAASDPSDSVFAYIRSGTNDLALAFLSGPMTGSVDDNTCSTSTVFVVGDTSTNTINLEAQSLSNGSVIKGDTDLTRTGVIFQRLGDL